MTPRVKSFIFVDAFRRRASAAGAQVTIVHKGDVDAGAIVIKYFDGDGCARLRGQSVDLDGNLLWADPLGSAPDGPKGTNKRPAAAQDWVASALAQQEAPTPASEPGQQGGGHPEAVVDGWIARARKIDPDLWVLEVENSNGQLFLDAPRLITANWHAP